MTIQSTILALVVGLVLGCQNNQQPATQAQPATNPVVSKNVSKKPMAAKKVIPVPGGLDKAMREVLPHYLEIQQTLAADKTNDVPKRAEQIASILKRYLGFDMQAYAKVVPSSMKAALALSKTTDIKSAREQFKQLSKSIAPWANASKLDGIDRVWCSMAPGGWLQSSGPIRNPYYGASMLECGEKSPNG